MAERFPVLNYRDVVRVARKLGFEKHRQAKGSHEIWRRESDGRQTTVHNHGSRPLKRKTSKAIFDDLDISATDYRRLLRE